MRLSSIFTSGLILANILSAQTYISGAASGLWTQDNHPFILTADAVIDANQTLEIDRGVEIDLGGFQLRVEGSLIANGAQWTNGGEIFGAAGIFVLTDCSFNGLTGGIRANGGHVEILNCVVNNTAETGISLSGTDSSFVRNSRITNNGDYGIKIRSTDEVEIVSNYLSGNSTNDVNHPALFIDSASPETIEHNVIENNHAQGLGVWSLSSMAHPDIRHNIIRRNFTGITLVNAPAYLENNIIVANYQEGNSNSGAGIYAGYSNSDPVVMSNYIGGNYYGVSNINSANCNLGDVVNDYPGDDGLNIFYDNTLDGVTWHIWNGTPTQMMAQNNYWPGLDLRNVDATLYDNEEGGGEILFEPVYAPALPQMADINEDTVVNVLDVVIIVEAMATGLVPHASLFFLSDVNHDFNLDVSDITLLMEMITSD